MLALWARRQLDASAARGVLGLDPTALDVVPSEHLWVNPGCGLKTRRWEEVRPALSNLVAAARQVRDRLGAT